MRERVRARDVFCDIVVNISICVIVLTLIFYRRADARECDKISSNSARWWVLFNRIQDKSNRINRDRVLNVNMHKNKLLLL